LLASAQAARISCEHREGFSVRVIGRGGAIFALTGCLLAVPNSAALAGTARLDVSTENGEQIARFSYTADRNERNEVSLYSWRPDGYRTVFSISDRAGLVAGPGCEREPPEEGSAVECPIPAGARALGPLLSLGDRRDTVEAQIEGVRISAGPGNDSIEVRFVQAESISGGPGHDYIDGSGLIRAGPGDDEVGGEGRARIYGGPGRDRINGSLHRDVIVPGAGNDITYTTGNDLIRARDRAWDSVTCTSGRGTAYVDGVDHVDGCHRIKRHGAARAVPTDGLFLSYDQRMLWASIACPRDGPSVCLAAVSVRAGREVVRSEQVRISRGRERTLALRVKPGLGRGCTPCWIRLAVFSYDRAGRLRTSRAAVEPGLSDPPRRPGEGE
jgi:hypothetical protein